MMGESNLQSQTESTGETIGYPQWGREAEEILRADNILRRELGT